jgi:hypothetical protein
MTLTLALTCHSLSDSRSERGAHSGAHVALTVPGEVSATQGVYKTPVALANPPLSFDPSTMVRCNSYHEHQLHHRRLGQGWVCDACSEVTQ